MFIFCYVIAVEIELFLVLTYFDQIESVDWLSDVLNVKMSVMRFRADS